MNALILPTALLSFQLTAHAATVAHFTASGIQNMGSADSFGGSNITTNSVAHELIFDFTAAVDSETNPINLWEAGGSGRGAALVLQGDDLYFFAGQNNDDVVFGNHGLTSPTLGVQIVTVYEIGAGTGSNELLSIYVNGNLIGTADLETGNDWAGGENPGSGLGRIENTVRYNGSSLVNQSNVVVYPETNIDFAVYRLASDGGPAGNTVANILVPEPSVALLGACGTLLLLRRRR
ncbi:hypothetical protein [Haloferula sp. A504]|uniref:hypothetical protein n=1 Tax=Haloferula sp. A504 TaxID=3373601 RepID=UPI0031C0E187|nr:hypothetical protein [Verrucomicrobiaceae bacterium E54]